MRKLTVVFTILTLACATVGALYSVMPINGPVVGLGLDLSNNNIAPCLTPTDSIRLRLTIGSTLDRRGDPVSDFLIRITRNTNTLVDDTITANQNSSTIYNYSLLCPTFGDSVLLQARARARDNRGNVGVEGVSSVLVIHTNDPGPVAPVITIDTIAGIEPDSIQVFATGAPDKIINYFINNKVLGDGYTIQLCPLIWKDGESFYPSNYITRCSNIGLTYYHTQRYGD